MSSDESKSATPSATSENAARFWEARPGLALSAPLPTCNRDVLLAELETRYANKGLGPVYLHQIAPRHARAVWTLKVSTSRWVKRGSDIVVASAVLFLAAPLLLVVFVMLRLSQRTVVLQDERAGRFARPVAIPRLAPFRRLTRAGTANRDILPASVRRLGDVALRFWPVLLGDLTLVGPRPMHATELSSLGLQERRCLDVTPGLISLPRARQLANIAHEDVATIDREYVETYSPRRDLAVLVMAALGKLLERRRPRETSVARATVSVLGVPVANLRMAEVIDKLATWLDGEQTRFVAFLNAHCANVARRNGEFLRALSQADLVLADGIGVRIAGVILGQPICENVNGTDLLPRFCTHLVGRRVYLLGAADGVAADVARRLQTSFPGLVVVGTHHGYFDAQQGGAIADEISASHAEVLLVAMGVPGQELFIARHLQRLDVRLVLGVGGLFDFIAGRIPRAPLWMRELGLEWVYRLLREPGRMWRRYLVGNGLFVARVLWARLSNNSRRQGG